MATLDLIRSKSSSVKLLCSRYIVSISVFVLFILGPVGLNAREYTSSSITSQFENYRSLVEELELRRRVNVLFPNPQSLFDGFQVGLVNVGSGNLTFLRRDLVVASTNPIVFGRVYDSRFHNGPDFGKGWRISLIEELRQTESGSITYIDSSGAKYQFKGTGLNYEPVEPVAELTDTFLTIEGDQAVLHDGKQRMLTFKRFPNASAFVLVRLESEHAPVVEYAYLHGRFSSVHENGNRLLKLERNVSGLVETVTDQHGRSVHYRYDSHGRLIQVQDLAGHWWLHKYDESGRLASVVGGNDRLVLSVDYSEDGQVRSYRGGRTFDFIYHDGKTQVVDHTGKQHTFTQNKHGATESWHVSNGQSWQLAWDEHHRVTSVESTSGSRIYTYTSDGSIASMLDQNDSLTEYDYDTQGRLSAVHNGDVSPTYWISHGSNATSIRTHETSAEFEFEMEQGHLISLTDEEGRVEIERNRQGYIIGLQDAEQRAYFERDELQRVVATHYPSGFVSRYAYDALGNRNWVLHSTGSSVHYRHDSAGNIVEVTVSDGDGRFKRQKVEIGEMNQVHQVIYDGDRSLSAHYDAQSRPIRLEVGTDTISIDYGPRGDSMRMVSKNSGKEWQGDVPIPRAHDMGDRAKVLKLSNVNQAQAGHRVLHFNEWNFEVQFVDPFFLELSGFKEAQAILSVANKLIRSDALASATSFEKPSNPVFQPFEYRSTNCCIPCSINVCQECTVGGRRASWWLCFCQSETLWHSYGPSSGDPPAEEPIQEILDIIQEYVDEGQPPPAYEDFTNSANTEHFTASEYNSGNYEYFVAKKMLEIAETVRAKYNEKIDDDPNTDYGLVIESGYRNPKKNKVIGGKETSKHMYGDAIDLRVPHDNMPANWTVETATDFLYDVAEKLYGKHNTKYYLYLNGNVVHIEYDP